MRLSEFEIQQVRKAFSETFKSGNVYLFGSRTNDNSKGGDIDFFLEVPDKTNLFEKKIKFLARLKQAIGDQKIDVVFDKDKSRLIEQEARKWGIKL